MFPYVGTESTQLDRIDPLHPPLSPQTPAFTDTLLGTSELQ